ncbi:hypothetical protein LMG27198_41350 [Methylocystis echinoides]|uniref:Phosphoenolpyruvate synthase n=1 Tax=Methylocystis echinoides TaxID=29468 RepID=A0A9W6GXZ4_9HYPH|nr:MAG: hypothetical protein EKK29_10885 [Hyphomicrobiales bacterium]GLI95143.1 hypothetical protein LMG27198_41350 [Methylocystis echinoides]
MAKDSSPVIWMEELGRNDVPRVGGKNASLGEMLHHLDQQGVRVPAGFATTANAYRRFIADNGLNETIASALGELASGNARLAEVGTVIRRAILGDDSSESFLIAAICLWRWCARTLQPPGNYPNNSIKGAARKRRRRI